jgi:hypothetical protein
MSWKVCPSRKTSEWTIDNKVSVFYTKSTQVNLNPVEMYTADKILHYLHFSYPDSSLCNEKNISFVANLKINREFTHNYSGSGLKMHLPYFILSSII